MQPCATWGEADRNVLVVVRGCATPPGLQASTMTRQPPRWVAVVQLYEQHIWWLRAPEQAEGHSGLVSSDRDGRHDDHDRSDLDDLRATLVTLSDRVTDVFLRGDTLARS